ncbi:MAG: hypothetical protein V3T99_01195 [Nitrososphaerales archaeon]
MSSELVAGIVGAIVGAMVAGTIAWRLQRASAEKQRKWGMAVRVSETLGSILSAYTPDAVKTKEDVYRLQEEWGAKARGLHILGEEPSGGPLTREVNEYLRALLDYVKGDMKRGELEHRRGGAKIVIRDLMAKYTKI